MATPSSPQQKRNAQPSHADVVILTALGLERQAILAYLQNVHEVIHPEKGTVYQCGTLASSQKTWRVAVPEIGMGGLRASSETEAALAFFRPAIALFVGIAGGLKDVALGDVVASTSVYAYEKGKIAVQQDQQKETFQARLESWPTSYALEQRVRAEAGKTNWLVRLDELPGEQLVPKVVIAPIAAGEKVLASRQTALYRFLREHCGDAVAVEMEGHGFLQAARAYPTVQVMVIRGISDLIKGKQQADAKGWQQRAARHAAAFAIELLAQFTPPNLHS